VERLSLILLRGNSPLFGNDLKQMGHLFFPGEPIVVSVPGDERVLELELADPDWTVQLDALPDGMSTANWVVTASACGPAGERSKQDSLIQDSSESPRRFEHRLRYLAKGLLVDLLSDLCGFHPGWGFLTGVRPTKLVHQMLDEGETNPYQRLVDQMRVSPEKATLVTKVAQLQRPLLNQDPRAISIYIGIPFCPTICSFCSFSIYPINDHRDQVPTFLAALGKEMEIIGQTIQDLGLRVQSIYFGGGTPTSPKDDQFAAMLQKCADTILKGQQPEEYTVEGGRPETFTRSKLDAMAHHGVTRISVNPQTTVQATLMHLGRIHTTAGFYKAYELVRNHPAKFIINSDIIIGLPGEGPDEVAFTLNDMKRLAPDNLTVHTLAIKRGSRLHQEHAGDAALRSMTPQEAEHLIQEAASAAHQLGQRPYYLYRQKFMVGSMENVGYSLPGMESLYNIQMMEERQTIIGLGASATSKWYKPLGGYRGWLLKAPDHPSQPEAYMLRAEEIAHKNADALRLLLEPSHNPATLLI